MIRKLLCYLGFHRSDEVRGVLLSTPEGNWIASTSRCRHCGYEDPFF